MLDIVSSSLSIGISLSGLGPEVVNVSHVARSEAGEAGQSVGELEQGVLRNQAEASSPIVVTAERYGEAEVEVEREFGESEIAAQGAGSIKGLIDQLASYRNDRGEDPVILVNGQPVGFDRSFLNYPTEALQRFAILKPGAASHYGEPAGRRVINLTLKRNFKMSNIDASYNYATSGGLQGGQLLLGRTAIAGATRWNIQLRAAADGALYKGARSFPSADGVFDKIGFVSGVNGEEISPSLSLAVGYVVKIASIPAVATNGVPLLTDFEIGAGRSNPVNPNDFVTLIPSNKNYGLSVGVTRPIGNFTASISFDGSLSEARSERGLAMVSLIIPAEAEVSPFENEVQLIRPFDGVGPLQSVDRNTSFGVSLNVNGKISGVHANLAANYSWKSFAHFSELGINQPELDRLNGDTLQAFNPFGVWSRDLLLRARNRSSAQNINIRLKLRDSVLNLPGGPVTWNMSLYSSLNYTKGTSDNGLGVVEGIDSRRFQGSGVLGLSVPISSLGKDHSTFLGAMSLDFTFGLSKLRQGPVQRRWGGGVSWEPVKVLNVRGSFDRQELSPTYDQLDAPTVTNIRHFFDYLKGASASTNWITGGNPELERGRRETVSLGATFSPFSTREFVFSTDLQHSVSKNGVKSFPELIPAIERAFEQRIFRDADGALLAVDARPINVYREMNLSLGSSLTVTRTFNSIKSKIENSDRIIQGHPIVFTASLSHMWKIKEELFTHEEVDTIDQLKNSGNPRHSLSFLTNVGRKGLGLNFNASWSANSSLLIDGLQNSGRFYKIQSPLLINLSGFIEPEFVFSSVKVSPVFRGLKFTIEVTNLLDSYRRTKLFDGSVPAGFSRAEVDPIGRRIRVGFRKKI